MTCPLCHHSASRVLRSAPGKNGKRRLRECEQCGHKWHTVELSEEEIARDRETLARARKLAAVLESG